MLAGADETLRFWRVFGEPPLAKDEKAGLLSGGGSLLAGAPLGGLRSISIQVRAWPSPARPALNEIARSYIASGHAI
eukprot:scaffold225730_cov23-Tisochrysis_lutea.AAC.1